MECHVKLASFPKRKKPKEISSLANADGHVGLSVSLKPLDFYPHETTVFTELEQVGKDFRDNNVTARMLEPVSPAWYLLYSSPLQPRKERAPPRAVNLIEWHNSHFGKLLTASCFFDLFNQ